MTSKSIIFAFEVLEKGKKPEKDLSENDKKAIQNKFDDPNIDVLYVSADEWVAPEVRTPDDLVAVRTHPGSIVEYSPGLYAYLLSLKNYFLLNKSPYDTNLDFKENYYFVNPWSESLGFNMHRMAIINGEGKSYLALQAWEKPTE